MREFQKVIDQWPAQGGVVQHRLPVGGDNWSPDDSPVAKYIKVLGYLGLKDPTHAMRFYEQALMLREASMKAEVRQHDAGSALAQRLAQGELQVEAISTELAKASVKDTYAAALREREVIYNAVRASYAAAVREVYRYGEDNWMGMLRPIVEEAVQTHDEARWDLVHKFAAILRDPNLAGLAMITKTDRMYQEFDETWRYKVGRPDLYHVWRIRHAERSENMQLQRAGEFIFTLSHITQGPHPKLSDMEPSWKPGLYTAGEVMAITERIRSEQEAAIGTAWEGEDPTQIPVNGEGHVRSERADHEQEPAATASPPNTQHTVVRAPRRQGSRG